MWIGVLIIREMALGQVVGFLLCKIVSVLACCILEFGYRS